MGTFGIHTFEDDHCLDWFSDLLDVDRPTTFFKECLDLSDIDEDEMEYMPCTGVLCAAVMIDGLLNGPTDDLPEDVRDWLQQNKKLKVAKLVPDAVSGLDRLLQDGSEMHDLWKENKKLYPKWKKRILDLKTRLESQ